MAKKFKYDVAVSFAEEDSAIAESIVQYLRKQKIKTYYYKDYQAIHWGEDLFTISYEKYAIESRCVLTIISQNYVKKYWTDIERLILHSVHINKKIIWLPLRIDNTRVDGLSGSMVYATWNNNPSQIATRIKEKLQSLPKPFPWKLILPLPVLAVSVALYWMLTILPSHKGKELTNKTANVSDGTKREAEENDPTHIPPKGDDSNKYRGTDTQKHYLEPTKVEVPPATYPYSRANRRLLEKLNGSVFVNREYSEDELHLTVTDSNRVFFNGKSTIHSINGVAMLSGNTLYILEGNVNGKLTLLDNGHRISGTIYLKEYPAISPFIDYQYSGD